MNVSDIEQRFEISGVLTQRKTLRYFVSLLLINFSTLSLMSVDGLVVGNFIGPDALASVSIFYPVMLLVSLPSVLLANGAAVVLSKKIGDIGEINQHGLNKTKDAIVKLIVMFALFTSLIQYTLVKFVVASYNLSSEMSGLVMNYAWGIMISMPFGLISIVGMLILQDFGKMNSLIVLSSTEGAVNILLDLFFVGFLKMGVAGAGYGTALANIVRASLTVLYIARRTDFFSFHGEKSSIEDMREIISSGIPECAKIFISTFQEYFIIAIILKIFPEDGGAILGICWFAFCLAMVFAKSIIDAVRPLTGLLIGAEAWKPLQLVMKQGLRMLILITGLVTLLMEFFPQIIFTWYGVFKIPEGGIMSLRIFCLHFLFNGISSLLRMYITANDEYKFATVITLAGYVTLPAFAYGLSLILPAPWVWLSYLITEFIVLIPAFLKYRQIESTSLTEKDQSSKKIYMSVSPDKAVETSRAIRSFAEENGCSKRLAYRVSLCMEEMTAYAVKSQGSREIHIQIFISFYEDRAIFVMLDDGECITFDKEEEVQELITDHYALIKKIAKSMNYRYLMNMNYTRLVFSK